MDQSNENTTALYSSATKANGQPAQLEHGAHLPNFWHQRGLSPCTAFHSQLRALLRIKQSSRKTRETGFFTS